MQRAFYLLDERSDIVQGKPWLEITEIAGRDRKGLSPGRYPPARQPTAQGFEGFYNIAITPASRVTLDLQIVEPALARLSTATVLGLRINLDF